MIEDNTCLQASIDQKVVLSLEDTLQQSSYKISSGSLADKNQAVTIIQQMRNDLLPEGQNFTDHDESEEQDLLFIKTSHKDKGLDDSQEIASDYSYDYDEIDRNREMIKPRASSYFQVESMNKLLDIVSEFEFNNDKQTQIQQSSGLVGVQNGGLKRT